MVGTKPMVWRRERSARDQERISVRLESSRNLELALLHLRKEVATLDVIVRTVGRERRVIALARFGFGLRGLGHVLLDQLCELSVFRLGHCGPPVRMINYQSSMTNDKGSTREQDKSTYIMYQ